MRITALCLFALLSLLGACASTENHSESPYQQPNSLMKDEIHQRVEQIPYQHRDELLQNLLWLAQSGEQSIPELLTGLRHENPKVRSSAAWVLGRIREMRGGKLYDARWGVRMRGEGFYADQMHALYELAHRKASFPQNAPELSTAAFRVPDNQLRLFD